MRLVELERRIERLEEASLPSTEARVVIVEYVQPGFPDVIRAVRNNNGFYCERRPGEGKEEFIARARELARSAARGIGPVVIWTELFELEAVDAAGWRERPPPDFALW